MDTVRFYNNDGRFCGWKYIYKTSYREALSWIRSGNVLYTKDRRFDDSTPIKTLKQTFTN